MSMGMGSGSSVATSHPTETGSVQDNLTCVNTAMNIIPRLKM